MSNASDACDKLRFESLNNAALLEADPDLKVCISFDKDTKTLAITGNGIGRSEQKAIAQIRSSGIADLRYGHVLESSWLGKDRFERSPDSREPLPLPSGIKCFAVAATTSGKTSALKEALIGDCLVLLRSALGLHDDPQHVLYFASEHQQVVRGVNHMELLSCVAVSHKLLEWLR